MEDLIKEAKQFLSIIETATAKDVEIKTLVNAGLYELTRAGVDTEYNKSEDGRYDYLIQTAIMMFVKANFGNVDIKEKELSARTFNLLEQNLSMSDGYKKESESNV